MPFMLPIVDETTSGQRRTAGEFCFDTEILTVRELIRRRLLQEVERYNASTDTAFTGLVQPGETDRILNGARERPVLRWESRYAKAIAAFESNGFSRPGGRPANNRPGRSPRADSANKDLVPEAGSADWRITVVQPPLATDVLNGIRSQFSASTMVWPFERDEAVRVLRLLQDGERSWVHYILISVLGGVLRRNLPFTKDQVVEMLECISVEHRDFPFNGVLTAAGRCP